MKKDKNRLMVLAILMVGVWCGTVNIQAASPPATGGGVKLEVVNGIDDVLATAQNIKAGKYQALVQSSQPINHINYGEQAIRIASLCASTSANRQSSYWNTMGGLAGVTVSVDRLADPAAWYVVPSNQPYGWQWFDAITTTFHSFLGSATLLNSINTNEFGHRLVISASGNYPVSAYTCTVTCSLTNAGLTSTFSVATNTATGLEIQFGPNFIGIDAGPNGICESSYDPSTGLATKGGDDAVYQGGQYPSQVSYNWWFRFGASSSVNITQPADFAAVRAQFANPQSFSASLLRSNVVVDAKTIVEARPQLLIQKDAGSLIRLSISGGQGNAMYGLLSSTNVMGPYNPYWSQQTYYTGSPYAVTNDVPAPGKRFFRLIEKAL